MHGVLIAVASLVGEHRLWAVWALVVATPRLYSTGSVVVVHKFSCSTACGISRPGIKLVSPVLPGGFFTTEPPGKP